MDASLTKSRWKFKDRKVTAPSLLRSLGIEFRRCKDEDFWSANAHWLRELWEEFQSEVRLKYRDLHPDTGGDPEEFRAFVDSVNQAKRGFSRHLTPVDLSQSKAVDFVPKRGTTVRANGMTGFNRHSRVLEAMRLLRSGASIQRTSRTLHMHTQTVSDAKRIMNGVINGCPCGRASNHSGYCDYRLAEFAHIREARQSGWKTQRIKSGWSLVGQEWFKPCRKCGETLEVTANFYGKRGPKGYSGGRHKLCHRCRKADMRMRAVLYRRSFCLL